MSNSIIVSVDSYKVSMPKQYPAGTEYVYSYIESRGGIYPQTVFYNLQAYIKKYLLKPITKADIDFAEMFWTQHGEPFYREGWDYILEKHNGYLPLKIYAVPEGTVVPVKNVLCSVVNTDPKCWWLTTWIETSLLRAIWYGTTVATRSWTIKQLIKSYFDKSVVEQSGLPFKLHDFGNRGVSTQESAGVAGSAHLLNFMGTDTPEGIMFANEFYPEANGTFTMYGYSIPASEHSTITSWGKANELDSFKNMIKQFAKPGAIFACVSDSYNIYEAAKMWVSLKDEIQSSGATLVVRPDSGDPVVVIPAILRTLAEGFGYTTNSKGYKMMNNVRIIWGDGITEQTIDAILRITVDIMAFSADNFAFGCGGYLLQSLNRDTQKFAMKASAAQINGTWVPVFKDPITDSGKTSKRGLVTLWKCGSEYETSVKKPTRWVDDGVEWVEVMRPVYENGRLLIDEPFSVIRERTNA